MEDARQLARRLLEALENPPTAATSSQSLVPRPGEASQQSGVLSLGKYVSLYNSIGMQVSANSGILIIKGSLVPGTWPHQVTCCHYIVCIGITNRVNSAIDTLRRVRAGMIAERKRDAISSMCSDLASAFGRKRGAGSKPAITSKKAKQAAWKHEFVLPTASRRKCPQLSVSRMNSEAKLGKKEMEMDANAFREVLYEAYPKLRDGGGFQLCRCIPNSRELEPLSRHVLSSLVCSRRELDKHVLTLFHFKETSM